MKSAKCLIFIVVGLISGFIHVNLSAQGFGSNPAGLDWRQINTEHYRIIFPAEMETEAQRVANTVEYSFDAVRKTLNTKPPQIDILLNNQGIVPNGYVRLAPRMSEWFNSPPQNATPTPLLGTGEWYNLLASHEIRHVMQYNALNKGFTYVISLLFGEIGRATMIALSMPSWVLEGDAVGTETALTLSGRGRLPSFDMEIRALELSGRRYSYYKAMLGSYDDYYPDIYHLGYLMTTHIKNTYGAEKFQKVVAATGKYSFWPFSFTSGLNYHTKKGASEMYHETMDELREIWKYRLKDLKFTDAKIINKRNGDEWVSYYYPQYTGDGRIVAVKHSKGLPTTLVLLDTNGNEKSISQISMLFPVFKLAGDLVVWNDINYDLRWSSKNYSEINTYDIKSKEIKRITHHTRLVAPSPSPDGKKIIAVEFDKERKCRFVILNADNGEIIKAIPNPQNYYLTSPSWSPDAQQIVYTKQKFNGKALAVLNLKDDTEEILIPEGYENINEPAFWKDYIIYGSPYSGIDNIFAINRITKQKSGITSRQTGAFNPCISADKSKLLFNDYMVNGYDIAEMPLQPDLWLPIDKVENGTVTYYNPLIDQEQKGNIFDEKSIPKQQYPTESYLPAFHFFNIHSWTLIPDPLFPILGITSDDILGTTQISANGMWNVNEQTGLFSADVAYGALFPILQIGVTYNGRRESKIIHSDTTYNSFWEKNIHGGIILPFNLSKGIYNSWLQLSANIEMLKVEGRQFSGPNGVFFPINYNLSYYWFKTHSDKDIKPVWGQTFNFYFDHTPFKSEFHSQRLAGNLITYLPTLINHHSLQLQANYEWAKSDGNYQFAKTFIYPRGYGSVNESNFYKFSADYTFPILYPDLALGQWFYFKRIRGNVFFDFAEGRNDYFKLSKVYKSAGGELTTDFQIFAWPLIINAGARYSYKPDLKTRKIEAIFNFGT